MNDKEFKQRNDRARRVLLSFMLSIAFSILGLMWFQENALLARLPREACLLIFAPAVLSAVTIVDGVFRLMGRETAWRIGKLPMREYANDYMLPPLPHLTGQKEVAGDENPDD